MSIKLRYYIPEALDHGVKIHPEKDMERMGMIILKWEAFPIGDAILVEVENCPDELPPYINVLEDQSRAILPTGKNP